MYNDGSIIYTIDCENDWLRAEWMLYICTCTFELQVYVHVGTILQVTPTWRTLNKIAISAIMQYNDTNTDTIIMYGTKGSGPKI